MKSIALTLTIDLPLPQARNRTVERIDTLMRAGGYTRRDHVDAVEYQPRFIGLPAVWAIRHLIGEHMTLTFVQHGAATEVRADGRIRNGATGI
jgi:hypothetical protein